MYLAPIARGCSLPCLYVAGGSINSKSRHSRPPIGRRGMGVPASEEGRRTEDIYIGDTPGKGYSVEGYKGRFIRDDPQKYPSKVNYGMLKGLAGGWAGGEVGLKERDLPEWAVDVVDDRLGAALSKGSGIISSFAYAPPALMPGMDVMINDIGSQYHNFRGILQRITDGRAAVLFEGGNWDKLVTFKISQLHPIISDV